MKKRIITLIASTLLLITSAFPAVATTETGPPAIESDAQIEQETQENNVNCDIKYETTEQAKVTETETTDPRISYTFSNKGEKQIRIDLKTNEVELGSSHDYQSPSELMTVTLVSTGEDITDSITIGARGNVKTVYKDYYLDKPLDNTSYYFYGAKIDDRKSELSVKYKSVTLAYVTVTVVDKKSEKVTSSNVDSYVAKFYKALSGTGSYSVILSYEDLGKVEKAFNKKYGWQTYKPLYSTTYYSTKNYNYNNYGQYKRVIINNSTKNEYAKFMTQMKYLKKTTQSWVKAAGSKKGTSKQRVKKINNYIRKKIKYDRSYKNYRAYDAMKQGKGVCAAYSEIFYLMAKESGLNNVYIVEGYTDKTCKTGHAWNRVKISGKWYHTDVTWNDSAHKNRYLNSKSIWSNHKKFKRYKYTETEVPCSYPR